MLNALVRPVKPPEIYIRPHNYPLGVGLVAICLFPNRQRMPVESFIIQAANANTGIIYIGDSIPNAINGLELVPGQAWQFSVLSYGNEANMLEPTPMNFATSSRSGMETRKVLNMADFFVIADAIDQRLKVFYTLPVKG